MLCLNGGLLQFTIGGIFNAKYFFFGGDTRCEKFENNRFSDLFGMAFSKEKKKNLFFKNPEKFKEPR